MNLIFDSCSTLGYNKSFEYIGDSFCFRQVSNIDLQGVILADNWSGVTPIWSGISGIISGASDYSEILINGESFGSGILNNISFDEGVDVRRKSYTASITTYKTGDLSFLTGSQFAGYSGLANFDLRNLNSISETSTFSSREDLGTSFQRSLSLSLTSGGGYVNNELIEQSKVIVQALLSSVLNFSSGHFQIPTGFSPKRVYSESFDYINGSFDFDESIEFRDQNPFDWSYKHSLKQDDNGIVEVSENGTIIGVSENYLDGLMSGYLSSKTGAFYRCSGLFAEIIGNGCNLTQNPTSSTFSLDHNRGAIEYDISFTSNPQNSGTGCNWSYSHSLSRSNNGYSVTEQGTIIGLSTGSVKYNNAFNCFQNIASGVSGRLNEYYSDFIPNTGCYSGINLLSRSITDKELDGQISYSYTYGTDNRYLGSGIYNFLSSGVNHNLPIHLKSVVPILNDIDSDYAISNYRSNSSLGNYTFLNSFNISGLSFIHDAIYRALPLLINTGDLPSDVFYLEGLDINFDPNSSILQSSVNYNYVRNREKNDIQI